MNAIVLVSNASHEEDMIFLFIFLFVLFLLLNYFDVISTNMIVRQVGHDGERNPIARWLIKRFGTLKGLLILKSVIIPIIPLIIWSYIESSTYLNITLSFLDSLYLAVVWNNFRIIKKIRHKLVLK